MRTLAFWLSVALLYFIAAVVFGVSMGLMAHLGWSLG
jgi:hypothetical protein